MRKYRFGPTRASCQSCRSKKLRCNRHKPCSNCTTRNITCDYQIPSETGQSERKLPLVSNVPPGYVKSLDIVDLPENTLNRSHLSRGPAPIPSSVNGAVARILRDREEDLHLLEQIEGERAPRLSCGSNSLTFTVQSSQEILETYVDSRNAASAAEFTRPPQARVALPLYRQAVSLLDNYENRVDYVCRVLHLPWVRSSMKTFYIQISQGELVPSSQASLFLSILSLSVYFHQPSSGSDLVTTESHTVQLARYWSNEAFNGLHQTIKSARYSLEDVQTLILLSYITYHIDGLTAKGRLFSALAISFAQNLGFHQLDADGIRNPSFRDLIDQEVKRRVFWHIAATDWLQSSLSGPQQGMYAIHPGQMDVKLPMNCNDDEIVLGEDSKAETEQRPTAMSYFLARVQLAQICRSMTDNLPVKTSKLMQVPYEKIILLDKELQDFLSTLPFFFRLDPASRERSKPLEDIYSNIPIMRYCITAAAHARRCRLHQKFHLRQSFDPRYIYSRRAALQSARAIIRSYKDPLCEGISTSTATARMGLAVHYTHLALVIMVMDVCFNTDAEDVECTKMEISSAVHLLEDARHASSLLGRSLDSLYEMLRKHRVQFPDSTTAAHDLAAGARSSETDIAHMSGYVYKEPPLTDMGLLGHSYADGTFFDELWENAVQPEQGFDSGPWDNLFWAIDSRPF